MTRRFFRFNSLLGIAVLGVSCTEKKPNIVIFLADDLGWNDLTCTGSTYYETPNIDAIAKLGVSFSNSYAGCSVSTPSRASLLTGKVTPRHGMTSFIGDGSGLDFALKNNFPLVPPEFVQELPPDTYTLVRTLHDEGYATLMTGKWHLGMTDPTEYGFDVNKGGFWYGLPRGGYFTPYKNPALEDGPAGENLTLRLACETAAFIREKAAERKPFFIYHSFYAVHLPIQTTKEKWEYFRDKAEAQGIDSAGFAIDRTLPVRQHQDNPVYAGLISMMDDAVGIVMNELKQQGLLKNTIVIFTSDNGGVSSGDNYSTAIFPLRGGKGRQWEGGTRVPLLMMGPGIKGHGRKIETPVINMDLFPTLVEMAGAEMKDPSDIDGVSLKGLLDRSGSIEPRVFHWHYPHYGNQGGEPSSYVVDNGWKLIHYWEDGREELYDLNSDPGEACAVTDDPGTVRRLHEDLFEWLESTGAVIPEPNPLFDSLLHSRTLQQTQESQMEKQEQLRSAMLEPGWSPNRRWWGSMVEVND